MDDYDIVDEFDASMIRRNWDELLSPVDAAWLNFLLLKKKIMYLPWKSRQAEFASIYQSHPTGPGSNMYNRSAAFNVLMKAERSLFEVKSADSPLFRNASYAEMRRGHVKGAASNNWFTGKHPLEVLGYFFLGAYGCLNILAVLIGE